MACQVHFVFMGLPVAAGVEDKGFVSLLLPSCKEVNCIGTGHITAWRIARELVEALSQKGDPRSDLERCKEEAILCTKERTTTSCASQGCAPGATAPETAQKI
jgi:hypothetical protein